MGITIEDSKGDTNVSCSYSSFMRVRELLWKVETGLELRAMQGFGGTTPFSHFKHSLLLPLIDHSDCDGKLTADQCDKVSFGLSINLQSTFWTSKDRAWALKYCKKLIGVLDSGAENRGVEFC